MRPRRATRAYGLSKCLAEDLCAGFTVRTGIASVSLRPVWVWDPGQYQRIETQWRAQPRPRRQARPGVPVTNPAPYRADPWPAFFDCSIAATTLGWRPRYRWSEHEQIQ